MPQQSKFGRKDVSKPEEQLLIENWQIKPKRDLQ